MLLLLLLLLVLVLVLLRLHWGLRLLWTRLPCRLIHRLCVRCHRGRAQRCLGGGGHPAEQREPLLDAGRWLP